MYNKNSTIQEDENVARQRMRVDLFMFLRISTYITNTTRQCENIPKSLYECDMLMFFNFAQVKL